MQSVQSVKFKNGVEKWKISNVTPASYYYHRVHQSYEKWAAGYPAGILLTIDRHKYDFVHCLKDRHEVLTMIEQKLVALGKLSPQKSTQLQKQKTENQN